MPTKRIYPYVEDSILIEEVRKVFNSVNSELHKVDEIFHDNVIDPFSAIFDCSTQNISYCDWVEQEKHRQIQKTLQNAVGYFHQNILGSVKGWSNPGHGGGYDIENSDRKIIAEIKNKHNTMNSNSATAVYNKLVGFLQKTKKGYTAYLVIIVPKSPIKFTKPFGSLVKDTNTPVRKDLLTIDGSSFYEMVTGDKNALRLLYEALPKVIEIVTGKQSKKLTTDSKLFLELFNKAFGL